MNPLEQNINTGSSFIIDESERQLLSDGTEFRTKRRILEHVRNGTDVILVTSAKHASGPISLESYFSDSSDEIRTISFNSNSFVEPSDGGAAIDLSMISAVVYESIHLDSHFAIIVDNADQFPLQALNELITLALGINTSKNNVNFIFSGGPNLLSIIDQISDIRKLSLAHCSLDELTEDDIKEFIDLKQTDVDSPNKLSFNKYALKKICNLANGSLHNASMLLEWIRLYSDDVSKNKVTVGLIDELTHKVDSTRMLSSYPPHGFYFAKDNKSQSGSAHNEEDYDNHQNIHDKENIEFKKQTESFELPEISDPDTVNDDDHAGSKTVYVESQNHSEQKITANIYEKVMEDPDNELNDNQTNIIDVQHGPVEEHIVLSESNYEDTYHLEALKHINDPLPYAPEDLPLSSGAAMSPSLAPERAREKRHNKSIAYFLFMVAIICSGYLVWSNQLVNEFNIRSLIPSSFNLKDRNTLNQNNDEIIPKATTPDEATETTPESKESLDNDTLEIDSLIELANTQIEDKKLTTPEGDNAFETFKLILEIEPRNRQALAGIEKIKNRYQTWAKLDINDGKIKRAKYFLSRAIEIAPDDREAKQLLSSLEDANSFTH